jgi:hypothetical protein
LPKTYSKFFSYKLQLLDKLQNQINFDTLTTIEIRSQESMKYSYNLYLSESSQKSLLDNRVFHEIKDKRIIALFTVFPPKIGIYTLEVCIKNIII